MQRVAREANYANSLQANVGLLQAENEALRAELKTKLECTEDLCQQLKDVTSYVWELENAFTELNQILVSECVLGSLVRK
eukprot:551618-Pyramimonas_sp.AAC.3